jgi:cell wall-associated NlpC family hydrolase
MKALKSKEKMDLQHAINTLMVCLQGTAKYLGATGAALMDDSPRAMALKIAWAHLGIPYYWGGDDPMAGFDCSGFVLEVLQSVGIISPRKDFTANGLWEFFSAQNCQLDKPDEPYDGCLVFWSQFPAMPATHVEMCLNATLSIGASGGTSKTDTLQEAIEQDAYIKIRPFRLRKGIKGFLDPFKIRG